MREEGVERDDLTRLSTSTVVTSSMIVASKQIFKLGLHTRDLTAETFYGGS